MNWTATCKVRTKEGQVNIIRKIRNRIIESASLAIWSVGNGFLNRIDQSLRAVLEISVIGEAVLLPVLSALSCHFTLAVYILGTEPAGEDTKPSGVIAGALLLERLFKPWVFYPGPSYCLVVGSLEMWFHLVS